MEFRGKRLVFGAIIATLFIPPVILVIPNYLIVGELKWLDTLVAVIVPTAASAFGVFFLRQFFLTLPRELEEAAFIDGANRWQVFWRIVLPLSKPALVTLGLLAFLTNYNDFLWPVYVLFSPENQTLPAGLSSLQSANSVRYDLLTAGAVVASVPRLLSVGRLVEKKGYVDLLHALDLVRTNGTAFHCRIYGDGPLGEELTRLRDSLGLQDQVQLMGARRNDEILEALRESDLFVLTPRVTAGGDRDGIPNVLVEAMACGLPVVTTTARARPAERWVPAWRMEVRSPSSAPGGAGSAAFRAGCDSPVRTASTASSRVASRIRASAGTASPAASTSTSPGTRSRASTSRSELPAGSSARHRPGPSVPARSSPNRPTRLLVPAASAASAAGRTVATRRATGRGRSCPSSSRPTTSSGGPPTSGSPTSGSSHRASSASSAGTRDGWSPPTRIARGARAAARPAASPASGPPPASASRTTRIGTSRSVGRRGRAPSGAMTTTTSSTTPATAAIARWSSGRPSRWRRSKAR